MSEKLSLVVGPDGSGAPVGKEAVPAPLETFECLGDRVLVHPRPARTTYGSLHLPETGIQAPSEGSVLAVGPDVKDGLLRGVVGNPHYRVLYGQYSGFPVFLNGNQHLVVREGDIIGIYSAVAPS